MGSGCQYCVSRLRAYLDESLPAHESDSVREHLAGCAACGAKLESTSEVTRLLRIVPGQVEPPPHFGADM
ncbi:MAG: anti-sigma factor family protein, partial [Geminicoccaceae bacterium]